MIVSSVLAFTNTSYALDTPPTSDDSAQQQQDSDQSQPNTEQLQDNGSNGVNVPYDDGKQHDSPANALSEDDKKTLKEIDKNLSSNADYDLLPQNPTPEEKADYHMKMFVNRVGLMSGITGMCSQREQSLIQECGELILGNWKTVTGETPPKDTPERRQLFRTAWAKREIQALLAVKKMSSPPQCSTVLDDEKADDMWKICKRKFVDKPIDNPDAQN